MQSSAFSLFVVVVIGSIAAALFGSCEAQTCDPNSLTVEPMSNMHVHMIERKKWYVQEIFYRREEDVVTEPDFNCSMHYVTDYFPGYLTLFTEQYTSTSSGVATHNSSLIEYPKVDDLEAVWTLYLYNQAEVEEYTTIFTHTDYETYGIMHWCPGPGDVVVHPTERILTFTGVPDPDQELLDEMTGKVASLGFPTQYSVSVHHGPECDYEPCEKEPDEACCDPVAINVPPVENIELEKIQMEPWFVQEIFLREGVEGFAPPPCYVQYFLPLVGLDWMTIEELSYWNQTVAETSYTAIPSWIENKTAVLQVMADRSLDKHKAVITHTDYDTYLIIHHCPFHENVQEKEERVLVFTRDFKPGGVMLQNLRRMVASLGFPIENGFPVNHDEVFCKYSSLEDDGDEIQVERDVSEE